jgi:uncharacterized damage-inducible protein DinB
MRGSRVFLAAALGAAVLTGLASAQPAAAPVSGLKTDLLASVDDAARKLVDLAEAVPADKYGWRPAPGVRSISEVFMHTAGGNFLIPTFVGVKAPAGLDRSLETKVTEKAQVVDTLKRSIAHVRAAVESTPDSEMEQKVKIFGRDMDKRGVFMLVGNHLHEHLGQSIAYARINGIAPPWSASEGAPAAKSSGN